MPLPDRRFGAQDFKLIGLVSAAHFFSHFYQLLLPPIFPLLTAAFGIGYAELGLLSTLTSATSGVSQTVAGILVDRLGSARVLVGGLALYSAAIAAVGLAPSFWWLAPLAVIAGFGNCVFHPADYAIMTARVDPLRLGRAYGVHTLAGNIGWVAAPIAMLSLTAICGWRTALMILGGAGFAFTLCLAWQSAVLSAPAAPAPIPNRITARPASVYLSAPILMCFAYFTLLSIAQVGLQTFLPSAVVAAFGTSIEQANLMLTCFLLASSLGILAGGILADRVPKPGLLIGSGLAVSALFSLGLALPALSLPALGLCASLGGFAFGATIPARDLIVRGAAPPDATGKTFGFVYSGLDLGGAIAPPIFGLLLDHHLPRLIFVVAAAGLLTAVATAVVVDPVGRRAERPA
jgi:MFS transporter, FSR family, fosmidomycin resistance protein